ncbi:MAG: hypothetical protein Roseis3KO_01890 [Roseivirga sp.]
MVLKYSNMCKIVKGYVSICSIARSLNTHASKIGYSTKKYNYLSARHLRSILNLGKNYEKIQS